MPVFSEYHVSYGTGFIYLATFVFMFPWKKKSFMIHQNSHKRFSFTIVKDIVYVVLLYNVIFEKTVTES